VKPIVVLQAAFRSSRLSRGELLDFQSRSLKRLVSHACERVAYFKETFDRAGVRPREIRMAADLMKLPLTERKDIRLRPLDQVISRGEDPGRLKITRTTGSTGEPFTIRRSGRDDFAFHVFRMRAMRDFGLKATDRMARVGTHTHAQTPPAWRIAQRIGLFRQSQVDVMGPLADISDSLKELRADVVTGNSGVLARISRDFQGGYPTGDRPRFVVIGSDLSTKAMRREITRGFGCPVHDTYCSEELGLIAWQCRKTGLYHVCDDSLVLEILKTDGSRADEGERGEVVATSLHFEAMPFIRYRLGDEVTVGPAPCPCGAPFSTISDILGRMTDFLHLSGGREIYANAPARIIQEHASWVGQYELVQENRDRVDLRIVPLAEAGQDAVFELRERIRELLGRDVDFRLEIVSEIVPGPGGKYRILRSKIDSPYDLRPESSFP
jgi:phenylacetate-CoA ligase